MSLRDALLVLAGGLMAGTANTVAGGGSLLTFPLLVAIGLPPLDANVTNTIGITPAALGGLVGMRRELRGQRSRLLRLLPFSIVGAIGGGVLLLTTPAQAFNRVVPLLIVVACVVLLLQRRIASALESGRTRRTWLLRAGMLLTAVYGGYFGAAVSVIVLALLAVTVDDTVHRLNAIKVPLTGIMNLVSGIVFAFFAPVHWGFALVLAPSTLVGGRIGAAAARRIPDQPLRYAVIVLGLVAAAWLQFSH
ncbi:MAG: sulfite exporter TauE/SafE family protein [Candidatus Dormibacteraeota bacterium]|uniref:Probable membrane transporter protein n=1 Tax=Candidatus Aeolococcus gillhamiae TaxID=3127015 RepID=A0A2W5YZD8_9BACT|nr:sulfite exporter TauE/SafE family protein [Candidatus Dormibacteraeota bacterium]PZR78200.1 MAG: sulfite exporter TauE/SafE family protein [Candidatus Dormibacter sp. RRmetagenome_bin12]